MNCWRSCAATANGTTMPPASTSSPCSRRWGPPIRAPWRRDASSPQFCSHEEGMKRGFHSLTDLPATLSIFPLTGVVLLPHAALPLNVFEPRYLALVDDALSGNRLIGLIQPTESEEAVLKPKLSDVGCAGRIVSYRETEDNRYLITLAGVCRFRVREEVPVLS